MSRLSLCRSALVEAASSPTSVAGLASRLSHSVPLPTRQRRLYPFQLDVRSRSQPSQFLFFPLTDVQRCRLLSSSLERKMSQKFFILRSLLLVPPFGSLASFFVVTEGSVLASMKMGVGGLLRGRLHRPSGLAPNPPPGLESLARLFVAACRHSLSALSPPSNTLSPRPFFVPLLPSRERLIEGGRSSASFPSSPYQHHRRYIITLTLRAACHPDSLLQHLVNQTHSRVARLSVEPRTRHRDRLSNLLSTRRG